MEGSPELRDFPVRCDWCGTLIVGRILRKQVGQMVVVQIPHVDPDGKPCQGPGRGISVWPVRLELRAVAVGYELRVGNGRPISCASRETVVAKLRDFGIERDEAQRRVAGLEPGKSLTLDVPERRRQPRLPGEVPK